MKIIDVRKLSLSEVTVIRFGHFLDERGFFAETYRKSDFEKYPELGFFKDTGFVQTNLSYSKKGVLRGLHLQWNPYVGKLVRVIFGKMIDLFIDVRKNSPDFGKIEAYLMESNFEKDYNEWIWIPVGFGHGNLFLEETAIEYYCTGEYNPKSEASISPLSPDLDWSLCDTTLKKIFDDHVTKNPLISEKDKNGYNLSSWKASKESENFYG